MNTPTARNPEAFTLVELLFSVAILVIVIVFVSQLIGGTQTISSIAGRRSDADMEARMIFNRMAIDFDSIARRPEVNFYFHHSAGNDALYFYSEAPGYFPSGTGASSTAWNTFSLVGYRISDQISGGQRFQMERLSRGLYWNGSSIANGSATNGPSTGVLCLPQTISVNFSGALADPYNNSSNLNQSGTASPNAPQWDVIGDEVFRLEFCYLLSDGTLSDKPVIVSNGLTNNTAGTAAPTAANDSTAGYSTGSRWYDATNEIGYLCVTPPAGAAVWKPLGLQDVQAVVVAIGILDNRSRILANNASISLTKLVAAFPDFSTSPSTLMGSLWQTALTSSSFTTSTGLPRGLVPGVRIYQRYFYVQ